MDSTNIINLIKKEFSKAISVDTIIPQSLIGQFNIDIPHGRKILEIKLWANTNTEYFATVNWHPVTDDPRFPGAEEYTRSETIEEVIQKLAKLFDNFKGGSTDHY